MRLKFETKKGNMIKKVKKFNKTEKKEMPKYLMFNEKVHAFF